MLYQPRALQVPSAHDWARGVTVDVKTPTFVIAVHATALNAFYI